MTDTAYPTSRFESIYQLGGIRTATFDYPDAGGGPGCRVAMIDTGSGLRFVVALDRGGDVVEASFNDTNLAYLTPNGYKPPSHAYHRGTEWLAGWPGGLVTTCGPRYMGSARKEDGVRISQHGQHSNTPAAVQALRQPDPRTGRREMQLELLIRDSRAFGPTFEIRRTYVATLGEPSFTIRDEVTSHAEQTVAHNWLYHVNLGYPLLDTHARLVFGGPAMMWNPRDFHATPDALDALKTIARPADCSPEGTAMLFADVPADEQGNAHVGLVNHARGLGLELVYPKAQLPRFGNWQHLNPHGSYVTAIEPFAGSLVGKEKDAHPLAAQWLEPGESRSYEITVRIARGDEQLAALLAHDHPLVPGEA